MMLMTAGNETHAFRGHLSPGASGAAVRRVIREAIDEAWGQPRREQLAGLRARGMTANQANRVPLIDASWNRLVPLRLVEANLLSAKGNATAP
jgi:hypothetical protein